MGRANACMRGSHTPFLPHLPPPCSQSWASLPLWPQRAPCWPLAWCRWGASIAYCLPVERQSWVVGQATIIGAVWHSAGTPYGQPSRGGWCPSAACHQQLSLGCQASSWYPPDASAMSLPSVMWSWAVWPVPGWPSPSRLQLLPLYPCIATRQHWWWWCCNDDQLWAATLTVCCSSAGHHHHCLGCGCGMGGGLL